MQRFRTLTLITCATCIAAVLAATATAQIPQTMSYQGVLTDGAGNPVSDGNYSLSFKLYTVAGGGTEIWSETRSVSVSAGIFSVILGTVNPLTVAFDQPYWLGIAVNGGAEFSPRVELAATAYSLNARSVADSAVTGAGIASGAVVRSLNGLSDGVVLAAGNNVGISTSGDTLIVSASGGGGSTGWSLTGNAGTTPGTNFLGTTDNVALELQVNGARALSLQPNATSPNVVGGHSSNVVNPNGWGQTVGGGGELIDINRTTDVFCTVGGGAGNQAGNNDGSPTNTAYATIAGGKDNSALNDYTTVGGGLANTAQFAYSVVGGGHNNSTANNYATISGGESNQATAVGTVVAGGNNNTASNNLATVTGGTGNTASGIYAFVGGGSNNTAGGERSTVAGGSFVTAAGRAAAMGGGENNMVDERAGTIGGGWSNRVYAVLGTIAGGGRMNLADPSTGNRVTDSYGTVGGGGNNQAGNGSVPTDDAQFATVGGGRQNSATGAQSTVAGGNFNGAAATNATVAGGSSNNAVALNATVGGGASNLANASNATVAGGSQNQATGGYAFVGGGYTNLAQGLYATVPGGRGNSAGGLYSFAAGFRAVVDTLHGGTFLFSDGNNFDFTSQSVNEFAVRATGGVRFVSDIDGSGNPAAGVELLAGSGTWSSLSDRSAKENIVPVDGATILEKLDELEVSTWSYRSEDPSVRHMGPMAQDFYLAFGLGADDRHITTVDADGVSLAAVQALNRKLTRELEEKDAQIARLEARLAALETLVTRVAGAASTTH